MLIKPTSDLKKILIIALSGIGDALMFTPALKLLKNHFPGAKIDTLVMFKGVEQIYKRLPEIENVHYFNFLDSSPIVALKFLTTLRNKYDISLNVYPSNRKEYNLISFLLNAKIRLAIHYKRRGKINFSFLNNYLIKESDLLHNVEENVKLVQLITNHGYDKIPQLQFPLTENDNTFAKKFLTENKISKNDIVIGFHPGCSTLKNHTKRRWEPENFAQLAEKLYNELGAKVLLFGGPEEQNLRKTIIEKSNSAKIIEVDADDIAQSAAVMKRCNVFVSNDSGLMHIAASQNIKIVAIIGPTNTNYIYPWQTDYKIASMNLECSPCFFYSPKPLSCKRNDVQYKCIKEISVNHVIKKIEELL